MRCHCPTTGRIGNIETLGDVSAIDEKIKELEEEPEVVAGLTMRLFVKRMKQGGKVITKWNEELWSAVIDCVVVDVDGSMTFRFKNGTEIVE